ncbi:MAG: hypothetical protein F4184_09890 [Gemmatimonadetes bacterium]|nr:hypothetical protein [Gemmatimonadota bacterium]
MLAARSAPAHRSAHWHRRPARVATTTPTARRQTARGTRTLRTACPDTAARALHAAAPGCPPPSAAPTLAADIARRETAPGQPHKRRSARRAVPAVVGASAPANSPQRHCTRGCEQPRTPDAGTARQRATARRRAEKR